jgi:predicted ATPase/DNA-binding SARP family transcriptional activator
MRFGILGPFEVADDDGREVALGGPKQRSVLAILLLHAGDVVSGDRLIDGLWGERPPATATKTLQVYVSNLRKALGEGVLVTRRGGYALEAGDADIDSARFQALVEEGRRALRAGDPSAAADRLRESLALWRGPPLAEFAYEPFAQGEILRLEELRLTAVEDRIDADLALGDDALLVGELAALVREHPLRDRLAGQLMLALYRGGRHREALDVYRELRERLRDELGLDPSHALRDLERLILSQDSSLEPAVHAEPAGSRNLPSPTSSFVGRVNELAELAALLPNDGVRLVTLTGAGGSGKTRLALRLAETCTAAYRDGTWFVAFADITDPELIVPTISQTVGLTDQAGTTATRPLEQWLVERQVLLVLDNLEQLAEGSAVLAKLLGACPGLTLLVTSREPLYLAGEQQYEVPVLALAEAVELFTTRAQGVRPGIAIDPAVARGICERVDCLALAIELAAARTKALAPSEILTRLDTRLPLLTGGPRDAPRRQQTLKATLDWSYELLDADQRRLFARLAVFAGGCTLAAAEAVGGATLDTLGALVDRSLLRVDNGRYGMLQTIREYAVERLEEAGERTETRRLHAQWFVGFIHSEGLDAKTSPTPVLVNRIKAERENFRSALEWAAEIGESATVAQIVYPLFFYWWQKQGQLREAQRWVDIAVEHLPEYPPPLRMKILDTATELAWLRQEHEQALAFSEQALALSPQVDDPAIVCEALMRRGLLAGEGGDLSDARAAMQDVADFARRHNTRHLPVALSNLAEIAVEEGSLDEARALCEEAITLSDCLFPPARPMALISLAEIANLQGRFNDGASLGRTAVADALSREDKPIAAWAALEMSWALAELGDLERAARLLGAAAGFLEKAGFARQPSDLQAEKSVLWILHQRLDADAANAMVQRGRDVGLEETLADALGQMPPARAHHQQHTYPDHDPGLRQ